MTDKVSRTTCFGKVLLWTLVGAKISNHGAEGDANGWL